MKSTLIFFAFFLGATVSLTAQQADNGAINTPGEKVILNSNEIGNTKSESEIAYLNRKITNDAEKVEKLYFIEKTVFIGYGEGSEIVMQPVKKNIYKAGQILIESYEVELDQLGDNDEEGQAGILKKIDKVQEQLLLYSKKEKTRPLEKQLRKLKTPEEIIPVFFSTK